MRTCLSKGLVLLLASFERCAAGLSLQSLAFVNTAVCPCSHCIHEPLSRLVLQGQAGQQKQPGAGCSGVAGRFVKTAFYAVASGFGFTLGADAANDLVGHIKNG